MTFLQNPWDFVIIGMGLILLLGVLPAMICFAAKYIVNLHHIVLQKRYSRIVFYEIIIYVVKLLFSSAVFITMILQPRPNVNAMAVTISLIGSNISAYLLYLTWVWRFYLLMYDISWIIAAKNDHWQHVINPTYKDAVASWFLTNKNTYGNLKWTFCHFFLPLSFIGILAQNIYYFLQFYHKLERTVYSQTSQDMLRTLDYVMGCVPFILLLCVYSRIPSFQDKFYIHAELHRILIAISIQYAAFFGTIIIRVVDATSYIWATTYFISVLCEFAAMSISTIWVAYKVESIIHSEAYHIRKFESKSRNEYISIESPCERYQNNNNNNECVTPSTIQIDKSQSQMLLYGNRSHIKRSTKASYTLEQILSNNKSFTLFMVQLSHEFSQEIVLAFVEMVQFQQLIDEYISIHSLGIAKLPPTITVTQSQNIGFGYACREYYEVIDFPSKVPRSYIVYGEYKKNSKSVLKQEFDIRNMPRDVFIERLKRMVWRLFEKYVETNSPFQINVPCTTQKALLKIIGNEKGWRNETDIPFTSFLHLFDECISEMYSLMMDSYARFRKTQRYLMLQLSVEYSSLS